MQVINEYYDVTTRKLRPNLPRDEARSDVRDLLAWNPLPLSADLTSLAWAIEDRFQLSYWDALIVGAAQTTRCDYLLTEDLQTDAEFDALRVIDPFVVEPGSV